MVAVATVFGQTPEPDKIRFSRRFSRSQGICKLESSTQYTGWEKALIYESKRKDEYLIRFKDACKTTSSRFDKNGRRLMRVDSVDNTLQLLVQCCR